MGGLVLCFVQGRGRVDEFCCASFRATVASSWVGHHDENSGAGFRVSHHLFRDGRDITRGAQSAQALVAGSDGKAIGKSE